MQLENPFFDYFVWKKTQLFKKQKLSLEMMFAHHGKILL